MALKFAVTDPKATTTVEIVGGIKGPVKLDSDMLYVGRIADKAKQKIKVTSVNGSNSVEKSYNLTELTLQTAPTPPVPDSDEGVG